MAARQAKAPKPALADPLIGRSVRVTFGRYAGKRGKALSAYRGRSATPDHVFIELEGGMPGWFVSIPVRDVEVDR